MRCRGCIGRRVISLGMDVYLHVFGRPPYTSDEITYEAAATEDIV
jgi:hypothetical protein